MLRFETKKGGLGNYWSLFPLGKIGMARVQKAQAAHEFLGAGSTQREAERGSPFRI